MIALPRPSATGFTLIEILVVLVIVAIIMTMAVLRFGESDGNRLNREAERLSLLMEAASDEAISSGLMLGWAPTEKGYHFVRFDDATASWQALEGNDTLRPRELPADMQISDVRVNLAPLKKNDKLRFTQSGVNAPFTLLLTHGEARRKLVADVMGRIEQVVEASDGAAAAR